MAFDMHSFCVNCGAHRRQMPFGTYNSFFDKGPCRKCGEYGAKGVVAKRKFFGGFIDRYGHDVDVVGEEPQRW